MKTNKTKKGFTLVELIVVIAILGILAAVIVPRFAGFQSKARGTQALVIAKQVATAIDSYYIENGKYPKTTDADFATVTAKFTKLAGAGNDQYSNGTSIAVRYLDDGKFLVEVTATDGKFHLAGRGYDADKKIPSVVKMYAEGEDGSTILSVTP